LEISESIQAILRHSIIKSSDIFLSPQDNNILFSIESEKRNGSCGT